MNRVVSDRQLFSMGVGEDSSEEDDEHLMDDLVNRMAQTRVDGQNIPRVLYQLTILSAIGGFLFGYDTGVVSGAMILISQEFHLSHFWHELIVSATVLSAGGFALIGGYFSHRWGRKPTILLSSVTFTIGSFFMGMASGKYMLLLGRIVVGMAIGLSSMSIPMYIAEACPKSLRGRLVTSNNLFITGGQFIAGIICGFFSRSMEGWRYMLGLAVIPSVIQFFGFITMPESPRFLIMKGKYEEAKQVLSKIRNPGENIEDEFEDIKISASEEDSNQHDIKSVINHPQLKNALIIGCSLQLFQQLCGINTIMYYTATIIQMTGISRDNPSNAIWIAAFTSFVNFSCTFIGLYFIDRKGRRPLLLISLIGVIGCLLFLSFSFNLVSNHSVKSINENQMDFCNIYSNCDQCLADSNRCGFCYYPQINSGKCWSHQLRKNCSYIDANNFTSSWETSICPSTSFSWMPIVGVCLYLLFFAPGMGPLPWTINAEIYPNWCRSTCSGIATSVNWTTNLLVSMTFLTLTDFVGKSGTFLLYAIFSIIALVIFYLQLPETKDKTLEQTDQLFNKNTSPPTKSLSRMNIEYSRVATD